MRRVERIFSIFHFLFWLVSTVPDLLNQAVGRRRSWRKVVKTDVRGMATGTAPMADGSLAVQC